MKQIENILYVQTQGSYLRLDHDTLIIEVEKEKTFQIPLHHLGGVVMFGNVLISPFLIHRCAEDGRDVVWLSQGGKFKGRLSGPTTGNVLLRRAQHEAVREASTTLAIARNFIAGKLQNTRQTLLRAARETDNEDDAAALRKVADAHADTIRKLPTLKYLDELRGAEGDAASGYFSVFNKMIVTNKDTFIFSGRNRRPPLDPVNALLSFVYALIRNECVGACESVGLDPQMGFLHALRPGRPALALDLMEEFRACYADRLVLTLINRGQLSKDDFVNRPGGAVELTEAARKTVLTTYQKRKAEEVTHNVLERATPYALIPHVQARLLARHLRGDLPEYQPYLQR
jgi:CRISP-associated protein Cas1